MNEIPYSSSLPAGPRRYPWYHWRRLGFNFLTISILAHFLFGLGATYLIVQTIQAKRKQTFSGPPQSPNAPTHAMEHKVQMQKKQQTMSAPAPVKRITTTSNAKVALPAMPPMPKMDTAVVPLAMAGMGGTGMGLGMGAGVGGGSGGSGGGGLSIFGMRENKGNGALVGTFFDFKQTADQHPTPIAQNGPNTNQPSADADKQYRLALSQYVMGGMQDNMLTNRYFKGPNPLYTTQIFIPTMPASEGPKAFNLESQVQPSRWIIHYHGFVSPPESGSYHFVGVCDDILVVRVNHQIVLDCGSLFPTGREPAKFYDFDGEGSPRVWYRGCGEGPGVSLQAGQTYPIDIIIGEFPGGDFKAWLLVRRDGTEYKKDSKGNPILPLFRLAKSDPPNGEAPVYDHDAPIWKGVAAPPALP